MTLFLSTIICINQNLLLFFRTEEKVQLANSMTDSMAKYMRRLDQDILKFKMELEADNCGITEIIEKSKKLDDNNYFLVINNQPKFD